MERLRSEIKFTKTSKAESTSKLTDSIPQIGVDKLHSEGITGKGIKVGVLDTGIDYNHPDLKDVYKGYRAKPGEDSSKVDPNSVKVGTLLITMQIRWKQLIQSGNNLVLLNLMIVALPSTPRMVLT